MVAYSGASEDKNTVGKTVDQPNVTGPCTSGTSTTTGSTSGQKRTLGLRVKSTPQDEPGLTKRPRFSSERRSQKNMVEEIVAAYDRENEVCQTPDELKSEVTLEEVESSSSTKSAQTILSVLPEKAKKGQEEYNATQQAYKKESCAVLLREVEVQCSLLPSPEEDILAPKPVEDDTAELVEEESDGEKEDYIPSDHTPSSDSETDSSDTEGRKTVVEEDKFIVFGTCLLSLFTVCMQCFHGTEAVIAASLGQWCQLRSRAPLALGSAHGTANP
ncbi:hypothetical protein BSL78_15578 [Apostichopus japonicus]|uniref:Uncharacterized protein n=1 Tax=Stichopus japonicus TaxID=307972 RepID=A0A2G8KHW2_STIJA|nr:hypothetical protein BSL78_15578 [Apostichopus japonicus]